MEFAKDRNEANAETSLPGLIDHIKSLGVNLAGTNVGASTVIHQKEPTGYFENCCAVTIYVNNNVQGINNSIVLGSEVNMRDPGVHLSFKDVKMEKEGSSKKRNRNRLSVREMQRKKGSLSKRSKSRKESRSGNLGLQILLFCLMVLICRGLF